MTNAAVIEYNWRKFLMKLNKIYIFNSMYRLSFKNKIIGVYKDIKHLKHFVKYLSLITYSFIYVLYDQNLKLIRS